MFTPKVQSYIWKTALVLALLFLFQSAFLQAGAIRKQTEINRGLIDEVTFQRSLIMEEYIVVIDEENLLEEEYLFFSSADGDYREINGYYHEDEIYFVHRNGYMKHLVDRDGNVTSLPEQYGFIIRISLGKTNEEGYQNIFITDSDGTSILATELHVKKE